MNLPNGMKQKGEGMRNHAQTFAGCLISVGSLCILFALVPTPWQGWLIQAGALIFMIGTGLDIIRGAGRRDDS